MNLHLQIKICELQPDRENATHGVAEDGKEKQAAEHRPALREKMASSPRACVAFSALSGVGSLKRGLIAFFAWMARRFAPKEEVLLQGVVVSQSAAQPKATTSSPIKQFNW